MLRVSRVVAFPRHSVVMLVVVVGLIAPNVAHHHHHSRQIRDTEQKGLDFQLMKLMGLNEGTSRGASVDAVQKKQQKLRQYHSRPSSSINSGLTSTRHKPSVTAMNSIHGTSGYRDLTWDHQQLPQQLGRTALKANKTTQGSFVVDLTGLSDMLLDSSSNLGDPSAAVKTLLTPQEILGFILLRQEEQQQLNPGSYQGEYVHRHRFPIGYFKCEVYTQLIYFQESTSRFSQDPPTLHENRTGLSVHSDTAADNEGHFGGGQMPSDDSTYSSKQPDVCDDSLWESVQRDQQILRGDGESKSASLDIPAKGKEESTEQTESGGLSLPESPAPEADTPLESPEETNSQPSELCVSSGTIGSESEPKYPLLTAAGPGSPLFSSPRSSPEVTASSPELPLPQLSPYSAFAEDSI